MASGPRKALGRGLDALIPGGVAVAEPARPGLDEIRVDEIRPNPQQPRERFIDSAIDTMAASLREHGVLQPVLVRRVEKGYELIAGERRWRGAQRAGLERIPAVVRDATPQESLELAIIENVQREDLNAIEEAQAYRLLIDGMGLTQEQAASRVGKERSTVANYLRLLGLPDAVQRLLVEGRLTMGHARALLGLADAGEQRAVAQEVVAKDLSVRQTEARVRSVARGTGRSGKKPDDPDVAAAEQKLSRVLGTAVRLHGRERGKIEIRFTSFDELNRLYDLLMELGRS